MKKRFLAFLMAVIMLFGVVPAEVFAQTIEEDTETGMYFIDDFVWLPEGEEPTGEVVETGEWVKTEETDSKTELVCTEVEHTHDETCPSDETGYTCDTAEHQHAETCSVTTTLVKWAVQLKDDAAVTYAPAGQGLPIHFFVASVDEAKDPEGDYGNFKESSWGKQNGAVGYAYAKVGTEDNSQIHSQQGIRSANDESLITSHVFSWPEGTNLESFKVFDSINIPGAGTFRYADGWRIQWVTICWRQRSGSNFGTWCNCSVSYEHIHIDGVLTKTVEPGDMKLYKQLTEASSEPQEFTFKLERLQQNSDYSLPSREAIDGSFAPLTLTAKVPANSTGPVEIEGNTTEIGFGYYKVTEVPNEYWRQSSIKIGNQTVSTSNPVYVHVSTNGSVEYSTRYEGAYVASDKGATFVNAPIPIIDVSVTKVWNDNQNSDGVRPSSITLHLLANGSHTGKTATLSAGEDGVWDAADLRYTWKDVPSVDFRGTTINYTVEEEAVPGYTWTLGTSGSAHTITNTHALETTSVTVQKIWNDDNDRDRARPTSIEVELHADGVATGKKATLNADNHWRATWTGLQKNASGKVSKPIEYSVVETRVPTGYSVAYSPDEETGVLNVTNTHDIETTSFTVNKVWNDGNNRDGIRPAEISVQLLANGSPYGAAVTLNQEQGWTYTWTSLPKNVSGRPITYTVTETAVPDGYTVSVNGGTITNTHVLETTSVTVSKVWIDNNDQDGIRTRSVVVELYADGEPTGKTLTLTPGRNWQGEFTNLPKYKEGSVRVEVEYTIKETDVPDGYTATYSEDGLTVTNTHIPEVKTLNVVKGWNDANNQDGNRPYAVQITLYKSGVATDKTMVLTAENNWTSSWENMPVNEGGHFISYTVAETGYWKTEAEFEANSVTPPHEGVPSGYSSEPTYDRADPLSPTATVTNSYTPEKTFLNVVKSWDDNNNQDGKRPASVVVELYADGVATGKKVTLNDANEWDQTFTNLDKYQNGELIEYTVKELTVVADYDAPSYAYDRIDSIATVTNKHTPEKTTYSITKIWNDNNDQDGKRPTEIKLTLHANGAEALVPEGHEWAENHSVTITLSAGTDGIWQEDELTATWTDLDKYFNGREIVYTAVEEAVTGYTASYSADGKTVTNTHTPATRSISVSKAWNDANDQDGIRPQTVSVTLYKQVGEGEKMVADTYTLKRTEDWEHTFTNLPVYEDGVEITYTVEEEAVTGYTASVDGFTITNTHIPETVSISARKVWNGDSANPDARPESITFYLFANNTPIDSKVIEKPEDNEDVDTWGTVTWENLPKYAAGAEINYLVFERVPDNYVESYSRDDNGTPDDPTDDVYVITNTFGTGETAVTVEKIWTDSNNQDGVRLDAVNVALYRSVQDAETEEWGEEELVAVQTLSAANHWAHSFTNLPTAIEAAPAKYAVYEVTGDAESGYTKLVDGAELNDDYTVTYSEDETTGFLQVVNTHEPEKTTYSVTKIWNDKNDQDGIRPDKITLTLHANGASLAGQNWTSEDGKTTYTGTVTLSAGDNGWQDSELTATWGNLAKYYQGREIIYSVVESAAENYTPSYYTENGVNYVKNTHEVAKTSVTVSKTWIDDNDRDDMRPDSITVQLYANNVATGEPVTLSMNNDWSYTWTELDLNAGGTAITYTVEETNVPTGYEVSYSTDGLTITNTHEIDTTDLKVIKVWEDDNNRDGKRPYAVQVTLYANGYPTGERLILGDHNRWTGVWTDHPVNEGGRQIAYTVAETGYFKTAKDMVDYEDGNTAALIPGVPTGYISEPSYARDASDMPTATVTNTYTPEKTFLNIIKRWDDEYDRDGLRPYAVQVTLKKGDTLTNQTLDLTADNEWDGTFTNLFMYEGGNTTPVDYSAVETGYWMTKEDYEGKKNFVSGTPSGYDDSYTPDKYLRLLTIVNKHEVAMTSFVATKAWADDNNNDGVRPTEITLTLHANGVSLADSEWTSADGKTTYTGSITLSANSDQSGTENVWDASELTAFWDNLKLNYNGKQIAYSVVETAVANYSTSYSTGVYANDVWTQTITNTHDPITTSIPVMKIWDDKSDQDGMRPDSIEVELFADGTSTGEKLTLNAANLWQSEFTDLDVYEAGHEIVYTVAESALAGYTVVGADQNGRVSVANGRFTITNHHEPEKTQIKVTKVWDDKDDQDGKRPTSITLHLEANGAHTGNKVVLTAGTDGIWQDSELTHTWENLDEFAGGTEINYTVYEEPVLLDGASTTDTSSRASDRYTTTYARDEKDDHHVIVTNSYTPETTEVAVIKIWDDMDNRDGVRPDEITVQLYKNGTAVDKVLDANGDEISGTAKLNEDTEWIAYWTDLPKYDAGDLISWSIDELDVPDAYESTSATHETVPGVTVITNTHEVATTHVTVTKIWDDEDNNDGFRPKELAVQLYANNVAVELPAILNAQNNWTYTFTHIGDAPLYVFEAGQPIAYTVKEVTVPDGYVGSEPITSEGEDMSFTVEITNTHAIKKTSVKVVKEWDDDENRDGIRPETVTLTLYANDTAVTSYKDSKGNTVQGTVTLSEDNDWAYTWADLYVYQDGVAVAYEVRENTAPEGYTPSYDDVTEADGSATWTVTNTHEIKQKDITVTKKWVDNNNAEKYRPTSITAQLYKNGSAYGEAFIITAADDWTYTIEVPVYEEGKEIVWTVRELAVPKYYTVSYNQSTMTITNTIQSKYVADTGDGANIWFWLVMMSIGCIGTAALVLTEQERKRRKG